MHRLYDYLLSEKRIIDHLKIRKEKSLQSFTRMKCFWHLLFIRLLLFLIFVPVSSFVFAIIIYGSISFFCTIKMIVWDITMILFMPITLLFFMNITNTSITIIDLIKKFFLALKYINPFYSILNRPLQFICKFIFELIFGFFFIIISSSISMGTVFDSLDVNFFNSIVNKNKSTSFIFSILVLHTAIYLFIRVYGHSFRTTDQKIKKLKMKFYLWFCSLIVSIVYIIVSVFHHINGIQSFYFIFVLMVALERTVVHYTNFIDFLKAEKLYSDANNNT